MPPFVAADEQSYFVSFSFVADDDEHLRSTLPLRRVLGVRTISISTQDINIIKPNISIIMSIVSTFPHSRSCSVISKRKSMISCILQIWNHAIVTRKLQQLTYKILLELCIHVLGAIINCTYWYVSYVWLSRFRGTQPLALRLSSIISPLRPQKKTYPVPPQARP